VHDQFGEQRIEGRAGAIAGIAEAVDANARPGRRLKDRDQATGRARVAAFVHGLHVDAKLHRMAARRGDLMLQQAELRKGGAGCHCNLCLDQIDAKH
jgi:hypothetical protein